MERIFVHLSDLHYRLNWHEDQGVVLKAFFIDLGKQLSKMNIENVYLAFSGDIVQAGGDQSLYESFLSYFDTELNKVGIPKERRICVPGNHDVSVDFIRENSIEHRGIVSQNLKDWEFNEYIARQPQLVVGKFLNYKVFESKFVNYGIGSNTISGAGWYLGDEVAVYCLNTALYSSGGYNNIDDKGKLCIDTRTLYKWVQENNTKAKVLIMHHPLDWLNDWSQSELANIIKVEFCLCLSGHVHDQSYYHFINKDRGVINCSAPPLLTNKKDNLGYSIITVTSEGVNDIYYRQWTKNNSFVTGVNFSDSDDGKVIIKNDLGLDNLNHQKKTEDVIKSNTGNDFLSRYLYDRLNEALRSFSAQPIVWVEPVLSVSKDISRDSEENKNNLIPICNLIENPESIVIQAPPQFGLTCLSHYLIKEAWATKSELWIYIDSKITEWHSISKAVDKELKLFGLDISHVKCIVLDSWVNTDKNSVKYINKLDSLYPNIALLVMQTIDDTQFLTNAASEPLNRVFRQMHLLALPRERIRKVVSDYNNERHIGEEDAVITKVVSDLDVLNIHRTPLNCLTLLKVSEKYFDESPINRAEMIKMVLFLLFNTENIPTYKSKPDLKDCEYVLGSFCENLIRNNNYIFTRDVFISQLNKFCEDRVLYLEVEVVFDVLYSNCIIIKRGNDYCFRFSYWVYYFAANRMHQDQDFANFILKDKMYANFPEIIEFYTGIDRSRKDAIDIIINDIRTTCDLVIKKVGLPEQMNPLKYINWKPSEKSLEKMHHQISEDVVKSSLPDSVKDQYADKYYDQKKPYNQTIQHIFSEYSLGTLMQCVRAASRALRNSDYVDPNTKRELLDEILRCWGEFSKTLFALSPTLAVQGNAAIDGLAVMLLGNFGNTPEKRVMSILQNVPYNVMDWFRGDLYSEKMGPLLFEKIDRESDEINKHILILLLIHQRPRNWNVKLREYIVSVPKDSFYLHDVYSSIKVQYEYAFVTPKVLRDMEYLIKMCVAKHELGTRNPGIDSIKKVPDKVLPRRLS